MSTTNEISNVIKNLIKKTVLKSLEESEEYKEAENSLRKLQDLVSQNTFSKELSQLFKITWTHLSRLSPWPNVVIPFTVKQVAFN